MPQRIVLFGTLAAGGESILEDAVSVPAIVEAVPDLTRTERVREVLADADVVVGDWPPDADTDDAPNLALMQRIGAGVDALDRERIPPGAYVCNVYEHGPSIAEHAFALLLALRRDLVRLDADLREGDWNRPRPPAGSVTDIGGDTLGIVGFGNIGRALVDPARGFGLDVVATRGHEPSGDPPDGVDFLGGPDDLDTVIEAADALVLSVPLTEETRGLIGERELDLLGEDGVLINVARGPVVDEAALYEALRDGRIGGAGIDTWYRYPDAAERCRPSEYPFHELDDVVMTPHLAGWSDRTAERRWSFVADNIDRVARGERPENVVWEPRDG